MESSGRASPPLFILLIVCTLLAAAGTTYTLYKYITTIYRESSAINNANKESLRTSVTIIDEKLRAIVKAAVQLADQASGTIGNTAAYETLCSDMQRTIQENPEINSLSVSYAPYVFDETKRLHSVQYMRAGSELKRVSIETWYDYTVAPWYLAAKAVRLQWDDPVYDASLSKSVTTYVMPIFTYDRHTDTKKFSGVFAIDVSVEYLDTLVQSLVLYKNSYAMLVTRKGLILAHPSDKYAQQSKTIFDLATEPGYKAFISLGNKISTLAYGSMVFTIEDSFYRQCKAIFSSIPGVNWALIIIGPEGLDMVPTMEVRHLLIHLVLALIALCTFLLALIFGMYVRTPRSLWLTSAACSLFIAMGICAIWVFSMISVENHLSHANIIDSEIALSRFFYLQNKTNALFYRNNVHFIPTGLYLYAVTLETTNPNMKANGHIWQKYDLKKDTNLTKEPIIFNALKQRFEKVYDQVKDGVQTIGWRFDATIKGNFDYTKYPFDQQDLVFALGNKNYTDDVILVPDFAAFTGMRSPHAEIDPTTNTTPWKISSTYSFYELTHFDTNFGIKEYTHQTDFPTLCFNIAVRRDFIYPFMASVLPIAIILLVAFSILLIIGLSKQGNELASLSLSLCSGLLFATILSDQTFQRSVEASRLTYFEYFYFLVYGIILLITIDGLLYSLNRGGFLINYNKNIIARLAFWPLALSAFLITTLIFFY
jgi:hypothetical protein